MPTGGCTARQLSSKAFFHKMTKGNLEIVGRLTVCVALCFCVQDLLVLNSALQVDSVARSLLRRKAILKGGPA